MAWFTFLANHFTKWDDPPSGWDLQGEKATNEEGGKVVGH